MRKHPGQTQFLRRPMFRVFKNCGMTRAMIFQLEGGTGEKDGIGTTYIKPCLRKHVARVQDAGKGLMRDKLWRKVGKVY